MAALCPMMYDKEMYFKDISTLQTSLALLQELVLKCMTSKRLYPYLAIAGQVHDGQVLSCIHRKKFQVKTVRWGITVDSGCWHAANDTLAMLR